MKKLNTRDIKSFKKKSQKRSLHMLTCYDYQMACLLDETPLDLILVGDSLGNVVLGYETTLEVTLDDMITFTSAVTRGAKNKFVVTDLPFGTYNTVEEGLTNATLLMKKTRANAVKLEGAFDYQLELIKRLTEVGIPVMGHIGLTPQSVHEQGGYYTHGKSEESAQKIMSEAKKLQDAGVFALVLECVTNDLSTTVTDELSIPTIGIGSGENTDGQVLVSNDLLKNGKENPPSFCQPALDLYNMKKDAILNYLGT
jgi:3-methyl-2-oxobutanoate hydroxymethyltransferase